MSSRRDFLRRGGCALGAAALLSGLDQFGLINALAQTGPDALTGYKALVCIFLSGGNDGNNMVIPVDDYSSYSAARNAAGLAIPQANLQLLNPLPTPQINGTHFGFHPSMPELKDLFNQNKVAVLCNVGTLVQPLTRAQYQGNSVSNPKPYQLFSHSDQVNQQQTAVSLTPAQSGWGGRTADRLNGVNAGAALPMVISIAGVSLFTTGQLTRPLAISDSNTSLSQVLVLNGSDANKNTLQQLRALDNDSMLVKASNDTTIQSVQTSQALSSASPPAMVFPNTSIGRQLKQVANLISLRGTLGLNRQIFFCSLGGFDTHNVQLTTQANLLQQLSQAMKAFYDATVSLGVAQQVTAFTLADFGRTFQPAGVGAAQVGSDHGWGNHQLIMGGSVNGGNFYGKYPTLALGGPDDTDNRGRWIPTTSVDQYAATLATWYGLSPSDVPVVFPYINRFASADLGFLS
ncbi:MAG: hypothetical protein QOD00_1288 [Blastocatellia bacterium]|jgi:uncharacterized protein (DUF1501 family)|nr:hypothetical protein [Blastocatellia bacterium]